MLNKPLQLNKALFTAVLMVGLFGAGISALAAPVTSSKVIDLVNQDREKQSLAKLVENDKLVKAAEQKAKDMFYGNYFAHNSPEGLDPWYWIKRENYKYIYAGENLAIHFKTVEDQHEAWMDSPTHRKNILNANYQEIGVAVMKGEFDGQKTTIAVQMFGCDKSQKVELIEGSIKGEDIAVSEDMKTQKHKNTKNTKTLNKEEVEVTERVNSYREEEDEKVIVPAIINKNGQGGLKAEVASHLNSVLWFMFLAVSILSLGLELGILSRQIYKLRNI